jgi:pyruvate,water dikinase
MRKGQRTSVWFGEITQKDIPLVGGKGANPGEITNAVLPRFQ